MARQYWTMGVVIFGTPPNFPDRHNRSSKSVDFDGHSFRRLLLTVYESVFLGAKRPEHSILPDGVGSIRKSGEKGQFWEERIGSGQSSGWDSPVVCD